MPCCREQPSTIDHSGVILSVGSLFYILLGNGVLMLDPDHRGWCVVQERISEGFKKLDGKELSLYQFASTLGIEHLEAIHLVGALYERGMIALNGVWISDEGLEDFKCKSSLSCLIIKMTHACNLSCSYCYAEACADANFIPMETAKQAITQSLHSPRTSPNLRILLTGGEPLLYWSELCELVDFVKAEGAKAGKQPTIALQTNGTLITESIADFLKSSEIRVGVSLDGCDEQSNNHRLSHSGLNVFPSILQGMTLLKDYGINYGVLATVTGMNVRQMPEFCLWLQDFGCQSVKFSWFILHGSGRNNHELQPEHKSIVESLCEILDLVCSGRIRSLAVTNLLNYLSNMLLFKHTYMCRRSPCGAGTAVLSVDTNGSIYPCDCVTGVTEFEMGNIYSNGVTAAISTEVVQRLTERNTQNIKPCSTCCWQSICCAPCGARSYFNDGSWHRVDSLECSISRSFLPTLVELLVSSSQLVQYWRSIIDFAVGEIGGD